MTTVHEQNEWGWSKRDAKIDRIVKDYCRDAMPCDLPNPAPDEATDLAHRVAIALAEREDAIAMKVAMRAEGI